MRYVLMFLCAALLFGCNSIDGIFGSSEEAELYTDRPQYAGNEAITLTLANRTEAKTLGYNLCSSALEELRVGKWQRTALQDDWVCTAALYLLEANKQASFVFDFDQPIPSGVYRFKTIIFLQDKDKRVELITNEFQVR